MKKFLIMLSIMMAFTSCTLDLMPEDGKSAYDIWVDAGNTGTEADFLASLKGADGKDGKSAFDLWVDAGHVGSVDAYLLYIVGVDGKDGAKGAKGDTGSKGDTGAKGVGILTINQIGIADNTELTYDSSTDTYTNKSTGVVYNNAHDDGWYRTNRTLSGATSGDDDVSFYCIDDMFYWDEDAQLGYNMYRITLTDGDFYDYRIYDGADGAEGDKGDKGDKGVDKEVDVDKWVGVDDSHSVSVIIPKGATRFTVDMELPKASSARVTVSLILNGVDVTVITGKNEYLLSDFGLDASNDIGVTFIFKNSVESNSRVYIDDIDIN